MTAARQPPGAALVDYLVTAYGLAGFERDLTLRLNALVTEAVAAERARCAAICRKVADDHYSAWAEVCETRIRSGRTP
jgi:hypothetical protein